MRNIFENPLDKGRGICYNMHNLKAMTESK